MKDEAITAAPGNSPPPAAYLPVLPPLMAVVEIAVIFCALIAADFLHSGLELDDLRPHPFWLPVLLLSLQYGTVSGLLAATVAIGLQATAGFPEQSNSETYFAYLLKIWIEPILWIAAAVLLGQFRMRQISLAQELTFQVGELESQRAALADFARNLRAHCTALERQIAGRSEPGALQVLQAIEQVQAGGAMLAENALDDPLALIVATALPGARATLYIADPTGFRIAASAGYASGQSPASWIDPAEPLFEAVAVGGRPVSVLDAAGEAALGGHGVAAVPVFAVAPAGPSGPGRVIGMFKIEAMEPAALGSACLPAMAAIARAFAAALATRLDQVGRKPVKPVVMTAAAPVLPVRPMTRQSRWFGQTQPNAAAPLVMRATAKADT